MTRLRLQYTSWMLLAAVLVMLGATTGAAFAHEIQHAAHHTTGMHSSGICAWMCATAGTISIVPLQPVAYDVVLTAASVYEPRIFSRDADSSPQPRAPPIV